MTFKSDTRSHRLMNNSTILEKEFKHIVCAYKITESKMTFFNIIRRFSRQQHIQTIKILECHAEKTKYFLTESSSLGQEPTVNVGTKYYRTNSLHSATGYSSV